MREHLYRALTTPKGIIVQTDDVPLLIAKLNKARRDAADPALKQLVIAKSRDKPETEVWIIHASEEQQATGERPHQALPGGQGNPG
jgi:hypothetical protein